MKAWLYYRLSKDDDPEQNSLQNQRNICQDFAVNQGFTIADESSDDNISGMNFSRPGLRKLSEAAERKAINAVIVKDLFRLGRHKTQTALFIDFLRQQGIRVLSATEGLDTLEENDDLIIGVRGLMNDYYARDIGQKIRAGYRQKQKEGLVIIPPFGYWKDKNTGNIQVVPEAADTVRRIYQLYLSGTGLMPISRLLNAEQRKTPAQLQAEFYGKRTQNVRRYLWSYTSVKNILRDESYIGVLRCHQQEFNAGCRTRYVPEDEQFRHENFYPPIILKEDWSKVQTLLQQRQRKPPASNSPCHRYAGLLVCGDCGGPFVGINRDWNGKRRVEYICKSYMRHGKTVCPSHRIHEEALDQAVWGKLNLCRGVAAQELSKVKDLQRCLALRKPILDARRLSLQAAIQKLEQEIDDILMEKALQHQNKSR